MKKERKDESFLKKPWYKGGTSAMAVYISQQMNYPIEAANNKIEGTVRLKLDIDHLGHVIDAKIQSSLGSGCDEEAIRLVKLLKFEVAKTPRKLKVIFHKNLNIHFKLPKAPVSKLETTSPESTKPNPVQPQINQTYSYTIVPQKDNITAPQPNKKSSVKTTYTIKF